jgi:hypothetical protein
MSRRYLLGAYFVATLGLSAVASGCATTINESAPTTNIQGSNISASSVVSPLATIDPRLDRNELLELMLERAKSLSTAMQNSDRKSANQHLEQILLIREAVRPEILALSDQLVADFDRVVDLARSSVDRNRPADADKALRFLPLIIDSLRNF